MSKIKNLKKYPIHKRGSINVTKYDRSCLDYLKSEKGKPLSQLIRDEALSMTPEDVKNLQPGNERISLYWSKEDWEKLNDLACASDGLPVRDIVYEAVKRLKYKASTEAN